MDNVVNSIAAILTAVIGLAIVAVLVGQNSQTSSVVQSAGTGFSSIIQAATGPATGNTNGIGGTNA